MKCPHCHKTITISDLAAYTGKLGGQSTSKAKVAAARKNARLGGRPFGSKNKPKKESA